MIKLLCFSMILILPTFLVNNKENTLKVILPINKVILTVQIIIIICSNKYPWLIFVFVFIQTLYVFYLFNEGILLFNISYSLIDLFKKYFHYGILYLISQMILTLGLKKLY